MYKRQHHNLLDHLPIQRVLSRNFIVKFHFTTAELFADWGIKTVFTGHEHCSDATVYTSALGNRLYDFATTSLAMYPLEYRVIKYNDNEIRYETRSVDKIDYDALTAATKGYTDEQISAMKKDLRAFQRVILRREFSTDWSFHSLRRKWVLTKMQLIQSRLFMLLIS